jgi:hypothetical protein
MCQQNLNPFLLGVLIEPYDRGQYDPQGPKHILVVN